ncbi:hypothetical protein HDV00_009413 [Rhizophlyctis rosea]|nr:hypothetical protein HDV00_009413 [Rhizophlyctis rosea]
MLITPRVRSSFPFRFIKFYRPKRTARPPPRHIHTLEVYYKHGDTTPETDVTGEKLDGMTFKELAEKAVEVGEEVIKSQDGFGVKAVILGNIVAESCG